MQKLLIITILFAVSSLWLEASQAQQQEPDTCYGAYKNRVITPVEFHTIMARHNDWLSKGALAYTEGRANLCRAILRQLDLRGSDLRLVDLSSADLTGTNLAETNLEGANLSKAVLVGANLQAATLRSANLEMADLRRVDLAEADLSQANMSRANLGSANLERSYLKMTNLEDAYLSHANMALVIYEPRNNPQPEHIAQAHNLDRLLYQNSSFAMVKLQEDLLKAGFRQAGLQVFAASRRVRATFFEMILLDWTVGYGTLPTRPFILLAVIPSFFSLYYWIVLRFRKFNRHGPIRRKSAIFLAVPRSTKNQYCRYGLTMRLHRLPVLNPAVSRKAVKRILLEIGVVKTALAVSYRSAFTITIRGVDLSQWMTRFQTHEFNIVLTGKLRVVSAIQALVSIYLFLIGVAAISSNVRVPL